MAAGPLFAVLAIRALDASKAARAAERPTPRAPETPALRVDPAPRRRLGLGRILANPSATARPRS